MGILNVTPDSFSDGGCFFSPEAAVVHAKSLINDGAVIVDVGGESTRPSSLPVAEEEELRRVVPAVQAIRTECDVLVSVDTSKSVVAEAALEAGADIINDVSAFQDPCMAEVVVRHGAGAVLMHAQGTPATMQVAPHYENVVADVADFLRQRRDFAVKLGMPKDALALDYGLGFGKTVAHNAALLEATQYFARMGHALVVGASRKSFLAKMGITDTSITARTFALGARVFRVHEPAVHIAFLQEETV